MRLLLTAIGCLAIATGCGGTVKHADGHDGGLEPPGDACPEGACCDTSCETQCTSAEARSSETLLSDAGQSCGDGGVSDGEGGCANAACLAQVKAAGPENQDSEGVAVDSQGNILVVGEFYDTLDIGCGPLVSAGLTDAFVAKLDPSGACLWQKGAGDGTFQRAEGVAVDHTGNVLVTGDFRGTLDFGCGALTTTANDDAFIVKLDPSGNCLWQRRGAANDDSFLQLVRIAADPDGNVLLAGSFEGSIGLGCNPIAASTLGDAVVAKLDPAGNCLWLRTGHWADGKGLATDGAGNVLVAGDFYSSLDLGCGSIETETYYDGFVAKLDASGACVWVKKLGGDADMQGVSALAADAEGNVLVGGHAGGNVDLGCGPVSSPSPWHAFAAKLDAAGSCVWSKAAGDGSDQEVMAIAVDGAGNALLAGRLDGTLDFGCGPITAAFDYGPFLVKLDATGGCLWEKQWGGDSGEKVATGLAVDPSGNAVVAGSFRGSLDLGCGLLCSDGERDSYVVKLAP